MAAQNKNALQAVLDRTAAPAAPKPEVPQPAKAIRTYREGRKLVSAHVLPEVHRQLKQMALDEDSDIQHLLEEAIDLLFVKKGKPPMARTN
jgi:hypothetical protein